MDYRGLRRLFSLSKQSYSYRFYSRNVLRRETAKILNSQKTLATCFPQNNSPKSLLSNENDEPLKSAFPERKTNLILPDYETLDNNDSRFKKTLSLIRSRKLRERKGKMILEGKRLINEAIGARMELLALYFSHEKALKEVNWQMPNAVKQYRKTQDAKLFKTTPRNMQLLSSASEVLGIFKRPCIDDLRSVSEPVLPVTIICDNIRDPGNLGSIIRHAASVGCQYILLLKGCVDPWETKVLKVGCGGHFHIPIINNIEWRNISNYLYEESKIFIADNSSDIEHWEQTPELINYDTSPREIDDGSSKTAEKHLSRNENDQIIQSAESNELDTFEDINLPCYLYSSVMFPRENIVLYIGGETHGVNAQIVKLACDYGGKKVKIPLENSMDSLNSSFALAIILYEIKRQLSEKL